MLQIKQKLSKFKAECICIRCNNSYTCNPYEAQKSRVGNLCDSCKDVLINLDNLTPDNLLEVFDYNKETGKLTHKLHSRRAKKGAIATRQHSSGYQVVTIGKKTYLAHRIIWFMVTREWPLQIDHIDHNRSNNAWSNLRNVKARTNQMNMGLKCNNSSGYNGVRCLPSGNYCAYIMVNRRQKNLGTYSTIEEAVAARKAADTIYGFHVNHGD